MKIINFTLSLKAKEVIFFCKDLMIVILLFLILLEIKELDDSLGYLDSSLYGIEQVLRRGY